MSLRGLPTVCSVAAILVGGLAVPAAASAAPAEPSGSYTDSRYSSSTTLQVDGTLKVAEVEDLGPNPSSQAAYAVTTDDGSVLPVTTKDDLPANGEFSGALVIRGELAKALDEQGILPPAGGTIDGDSAAGQAAIATAEDQGTALPVADATVAPASEVSQSVTPSAQRAYVVKMVNQGSVDGDNITIGQKVDDMLAYWTTESDGAISSFTRVGDILDYTTSASIPVTASCGMKDPFPIWNDASSLFPGINFNAPGNHLIVLVGDECGHDGPVGVATIGSSLASGGPSILTYDTTSFKQTGVHELGHNFGLQHANLDSCPTPSICEYFDFYSPMAASTGNQFTPPALGTLYRSELGLTTPSEVTTVTSGDTGLTQTYALAPRAASTGLRGLLVTDPTSGTTYSVDLRSGTDRDTGGFYGSGYGFASPAPIYPSGVVFERQSGLDATYLMTHAVGDRQSGSYAAGTTFSPSSGLSVTVNSIGSSTASVTVTIAAPPAVSSAKPTISGTLAVGQTVAAQTSGWATGTTFAYDWKVDGTSTGVTTQTFSVPDTAVGKQLTVAVTGSKSGFGPATRTSDAAMVSKGSLTSSVPSFDTAPVVDQTVTAQPGAWTSGTQFAYDWRLNGTSTGVTSAIFPVSDSAVGQSLTVAVTGTRTGYNDKTVTSSGASVAAHPMDSVVPTVSGTPAVGEQLTAEPGAWTSGTAFTYLWKVDGATVGISTRTFDVPASAADKTVTVTVTGTRSGYTTTSRTSAAVTIAKASLTSPAPTITGTVAVAQTVVADTTGWTAATKFTYDWKLDGVSTGVTTRTYLLPDTASGSSLSVTVTGSRNGYAAATKASAASTVALGTLASSVPSLSGVPVVGETVTAVLGTWTSGTTFTYLWKVDGVSTGVTTASLAVPASAVDKPLTLEVTGRRSGYASTTEVSQEEPVAAGTLATSTPTIAGTVAVGRTVTADPGAWTPGTSFTYDWLVGGASTGVTTPTFDIADLLEGQTLTVLVTGTQAGYADDFATSSGRVVASGTLATSAPTISGTVAVGETVAAQATGWTSGAAFAYDWRLDGISTGVTSRTFDVPVSAAGQALTVAVTGTKAGYSSATTTSAATTVAAKLLSSSTPTISGTVAVGASVTAAEGAWTDGTDFAYDWKVDGVSTGSTSRTFVVPASAVGKPLTVAVAGTKPGYSPASRTSGQYTVAPGTLVASEPTISGTVGVAETVTAEPGAWSEGTGFAYDWKVDGVSTGSTSRTFVVPASAAGKPLTVAVTGTKPGYTATTRTSAASSVAPGAFAAKPAVIGGAAKVGSTLTAGTSTWTPEPTFSYAWVSGTTTIGTGRTLVVPASAVGRPVKLTITGSRAGYVTAPVTASSASVAPGTLAGPVPRISGTAKVGKVLKATAGSWTPGTTLKYQWYAGSSAISKATGTSLKLTTSQKGKVVTVRVTGTKAGYTSATKASAPTKKVAK